MVSPEISLEHNLFMNNIVYMKTVLHYNCYAQSERITHGHATASGYKQRGGLLGINTAHAMRCWWVSINLVIQ